MQREPIPPDIPFPLALPPGSYWMAWPTWDNPTPGRHRMSSIVESQQRLQTWMRPQVPRVLEVSPSIYQVAPLLPIRTSNLEKQVCILGNRKKHLTAD